MGRPAGVPNKDKRLFREVIEAALGKSVPERLLELVASETFRHREIDVLLDLMPYCYAKLAPIQLAAPMSAEEEILFQRQTDTLSTHLDDDPDPTRAR